MFNKKKAQVEILKAMFEPRNQVCKCIIDRKVALSTNGITAYLIDIDDAKIDLDKIPDRDVLKAAFDMSGAVQYFDSDVRKRSTIDIIARLESKDADRVYVKQKYLNKFPDCTYWSNPKSKMGVVICCDYMKNPVGLIMPVRANKYRF